MGPPDAISHDAGKNFSSEEFKSEAHIMGITVNEVPIEAHWSIGKLERYHAPLRRAWNILYAELRNNCSKQAILKIAVKAVNSTAGPDGLVPTLLVFCAYPRMTHDSVPSPTSLQRTHAIEKAMKALRQKSAERTVRDALHARNGPNVTNVLNLPIGSQVIVYQEKGGWQGPFKILAIKGHDVTLDINRKPVKFRSTVIKSIYQEVNENDIQHCETLRNETNSHDTERNSDTDGDEYVPEEPTVIPNNRGRGRPKGSKNKPKQYPQCAITQTNEIHFIESFLSDKEEYDRQLCI